jgi:hypothetical protein
MQPGRHQRAIARTLTLGCRLEWQQAREPIVLSDNIPGWTPHRSRPNQRA